MSAYICMYNVLYMGLLRHLPLSIYINLRINITCIYNVCVKDVYRDIYTYI